MGGVGRPSDGATVSSRKVMGGTGHQSDGAPAWTPQNGVATLSPWTVNGGGGVRTGAAASAATTFVGLDGPTSTFSPTTTATEIRTTGWVNLNREKGTEGYAAVDVRDTTTTTNGIPTSMMMGVIGGVVGLLLLIIIIATALILLHRRNQRRDSSKPPVSTWPGRRRSFHQGSYARIRGEMDHPRNLYGRIKSRVHNATNHFIKPPPRPWRMFTELSGASTGPSTRDGGGAPPEAVGFAERGLGGLEKAK
ncbi:hypothetical protein HDU67_001790, partial [Dinochytrium kinnereticum]